MTDHEKFIAIKKLKVAIEATNPLLLSALNGFIGAAGSAQGLACYTANISASWRSDIEKSLHSLPAVCRNILSDHDVKIVLAGHPADIGRISAKPNPDDLYKRSHIEIPAHYSYYHRAIVLPETHFDKGLGKNVSMDSVPQIVMHELTHALDDILKISEQPEALSAYKIDATSLRTPQMVEKYGCLLQDTKESRAEVIAEMGSLIWTGKSITGARSLEWRCLSSWMTAYFNEIATTYAPENGLTAEFKNAAAKKAETAILREFIVGDSIGYDLMSGVAAKFSRQPKHSHYHNIPLGHLQKKQAIKDILLRQGSETVSRIWFAHNERMNPLPIPDPSP